MYLKGLGTPQDYVQALKWFKLAAEHGSATAERNLGYLYLKGLGVAPDLAQARTFFAKAADQGSESAKESLAAIDAQTAPQSAQSATNTE
jgi:hypothetical protein